METPHFLAIIEDGEYDYAYGSPFCWGCGYALVIFLNEDNRVEWDFY